MNNSFVLLEMGYLTIKYYSENVKLTLFNNVISGFATVKTNYLNTEQWKKKLFQEFKNNKNMAIMRSAVKNLHFNFADGAQFYKLGLWGNYHYEIGLNFENFVCNTISIWFSMNFCTIKIKCLWLEIRDRQGNCAVRTTLVTEFVQTTT